jgi:hypothetical protein
MISRKSIQFHSAEKKGSSPMCSGMAEAIKFSLEPLQQPKEEEEVVAVAAVVVVGKVRR